MATVAEEIAALRGTRRATFKDLLRNPSFSRLWRSMLASSAADWTCFVAVASLVARLGGERLGGTAVAGVMVARLLPSVLFGPIAGVFADRFDRRKLMIGAHVARGVMYASMAFVPSLWMIYLLSFSIECLSLIWNPAKDAIVPNLVPRRQLANANSVNMVTTYGTLPLGATIYTALAGIATAIGARIDFFEGRPEALALWLGALAFFFSARMVSGIDPRRGAGLRARAGAAPRLSPGLAFQEIREGIRFLRKHALVRAMTLGIVMAFAGAGAVMSLGPVFSRYTLHAGSTGFGFLMIALGAGMGLGMASLAVLVRFVDRDRLHYGALFGSGLFLLVIAAMPTIGLAALFTVPMGAAAGLAWVSGYTMLQENVSDEFRGRTFASLTVSAHIALFLSLAGFPALATAVGNHSATLAGRGVDLSGTRLALWLGALVVVSASMLSRRGLKRSRLARPRALGLLPKSRKPEGTGKLIVFEGGE
ncbi:MAG: MFS transporter, partial [Actinobacteria bacterium]|nr:MFS transporter [Actinomycetota bacterium]